MYKQIIIVRKDLQMSHGKMAAQVSHASMAFLTKMIQDHYIGPVFDNPFHGMKPLGLVAIDGFQMDQGLYDEWIGGSFTKCILEAKNKTQLLKAREKALELGLREGEEFFLIKDNCYTELTPEEDGRCLTCIGFMPLDSEIIDQIGKKYQLYKG